MQVFNFCCSFLCYVFALQFALCLHWTFPLMFPLIQQVPGNHGRNVFWSWLYIYTWRSCKANMAWEDLPKIVTGKQQYIKYKCFLYAWASAMLTYILTGPNPFVDLVNEAILYTSWEETIMFLKLDGIFFGNQECWWAMMAASVKWLATGSVIGFISKKGEGLFLFGIMTRLGQGLIQRVLGSVSQLKWLFSWSWGWYFNSPFTRKLPLH